MRAIRSWVRRPPISAGTTVPSHPAPAWHDLADNRPGRQVRAKAIDLRRAEPVRSLLGRLLDVQTPERRFRMGAQGEAYVGRRLARLDPVVWRVLHSVPIGRGHTDIDHLVIGPPGVFTLNAKHRRGARVAVYANGCWVNGQRSEYLWASRSEARTASRCLSSACGYPVRVTPVVVFVHARLRVVGQPRGAVMLDAEELLRWLHGRPPVLSAEAVDAVYRWARRSTIWSDRDDQSEG